MQTALAGLAQWAWPSADVDSSVSRFGLKEEDDFAWRDGANRWRYLGTIKKHWFIRGFQAIDSDSRADPKIVK